MKRLQYLIISLAVVVVLLLIFGSQMFYVIKPGVRAVIFRKFSTGLDKERIYEPGFHIIAPWNDLIKYDVREKKSEETMDVLDKGGLSVNVDITVIFNPIHEKIGYLHENIGEDYVSVMVIPNVRSTVRAVTGRYSAEEIYSTKRAEVEKAIIEETRRALAAKNIDMKDLLIRSIALPEKIKQAIEDKLQQQQEALAYQFRLEREASEADRKRIEAQGIADYNKIISASLTDRILRQKGIDATLTLANSPNSKVVVIGSGDEGMPLILGGN
ncbi:MAG: prohibitin family protein [Bacteroidales bacterium]|nr:prohibitin family protein [Bacteroidales bacterium]MBN2697407.1 prohibitin family protein [Bacteroidales bacterium]